MRFSHLFRIVATVVATSLAVAAAESELDIITKAREYRGSAEKLDALRSVHYQGTLTSEGGKTYALEQFFQKPYQQRISATGPDTIETTVLDGYDAWQRFEDPADPSRWKLNVLTSDQVKRLRANTYEHLNFFRVPPMSEIEDAGLVDLEGVQVRKVIFRHDPKVSFTRYFDPKTGKLLRTESELGAIIVEEGEVVVDGIRFPKKVIHSNKGADGKLHTLTIEFDKITLNETCASSLFSMPLLNSSAPAR